MDVQTRATYRLDMLGGLALGGGAAPLAGAATQRKTLLLLAAIAAAGAQGISRERLVGLFWAESDEERARAALKQALHSLRRDLRDPEAVTGVQTLRLDPERVASDVAEFEAALARGELERAVALYRGPFLDGIHLDGAPEFERWTERERARLADAHADALERLATQAAEAGDHARAVSWWRRRAAADPLSSRVAVELMKALVAAGDPAAALQHARVHETLVRQELDAAPDPAVAALAARVREGLRAPRPPERAAAATPGAADVAPVAQPDAAADAVPAASSVAPPAAPPAARPRGRRYAALAASLATVAALGALAAARQEGREAPPAGTAPAPRSVAVLPFVNMSSDPSHAYFSDGLSEELIAALGRVEGLRVAARTSSFALRDAGLDVRTIGDTLGVAAVVEGSVRRQGDRLRVTAQLVDARSGYQLWSGEFDRKLADVFAVQDELAGSIARALQVTLAGGGRGGAPTGSREAYDLYLRGNFFRNRLTKDAIFKAIEQYDRAIALDPGYALAHAGKASAMGPLFYFRHVPREPGLTAMRAAARRALELDDGLGEAHVAMGIAHFFYDWDWPAAERAFRRAAELNPGDAHAYHMLANYHHAMRRMDEAIAARRHAFELDPLNARTAITLAGDYVAAGQYDRAVELYRHAVDIDSMHPLGLGLGPALPSGMGEVYERQGRHERAVEEYVRVAARRGATAKELADLRRGYAADGMRGFWRRWLAFEERAAAGAPRALRVAAIHVRTGDTARAVAELERAFAERDPGLVFLASEPEWETVRAHPRVAALLARMGLPR